ncbi:hypothetical protein [Actibacterium sp. D379-3]
MILPIVALGTFSGTVAGSAALLADSSLLFALCAYALTGNLVSVLIALRFPEANPETSFEGEDWPG